MLILISGKMGSGKTTLSDRLKKMLHNYIDTSVIKFADPLYELHGEIRMILKSYDKENTLGYDYVKKDGNLLQLLGTEWGRNTIDKDIWVKMLIARVKEYFAEKPRQVIIADDCRFFNEIDMPKKAFDKNVITIRLNCDREIRKQRCEMWRENENHPSECDLDNYHDFDIIADSGLMDAQTLSQDIFNIILKSLIYRGLV